MQFYESTLANDDVEDGLTAEASKSCKTKTGMGIDFLQSGPINQTDLFQYG
jgi:hypothetical protein